MTPVTSISKDIRVVPLQLTVPLTCRGLYHKKGVILDIERWMTVELSLHHIAGQTGAK